MLHEMLALCGDLLLNKFAMILRNNSSGPSSAAHTLSYSMLHLCVAVAILPALDMAMHDSNHDT